MFAFAPTLSAILMISWLLKCEKAYFVLFMLILFFMLKILTSFLEKFDTQKIISHSCQLGDTDCRNEGKSPVSRFTILGFHGIIFFVIFIRDAIFQLFQGCFFLGGGIVGPSLRPLHYALDPLSWIMLCRWILVIFLVFRLFQAKAFDFVQSDPGHHKEDGVTDYENS